VIYSWLHNVQKIAAKCLITTPDIKNVTTLAEFFEVGDDHDLSYSGNLYLGGSTQLVSFKFLASSIPRH